MAASQVHQELPSRWVKLWVNIQTVETWGKHLTLEASKERRQQRWKAEIKSFNFMVIHVGKLRGEVFFVRLSEFPLLIKSRTKLY